MYLLTPSPILPPYPLLSGDYLFVLCIYESVLILFCFLESTYKNHVVQVLERPIFYKYKGTYICMYISYIYVSYIHICMCIYIYIYMIYMYLSLSIHLNSMLLYNILCPNSAYFHCSVSNCYLSGKHRTTSAETFSSKGWVCSYTVNRMRTYVIIGKIEEVV